jgi:hypothetical protein
MMSCRQATQLMSEGQDRPLSLKEKCALKLHKMLCGGCRRFDLHLSHLRKLAQTYVKFSGAGSDDYQGPT